MNIVFPIYILYTKNKNPGEANLPGFFIYIYISLDGLKALLPFMSIRFHIYC